MENLGMLVQELCKLPNETSWVEFKQDNCDPYMIGRSISALANSAALYDKSCAYMLWGVEDSASHTIRGTNCNLQTQKKGNQELENWLRCLLSSNAEFDFHMVLIDDKSVGVLVVYKAANQTVTFEKTDYIRVGSYTRKLKDFPSLQTQLWDKIRSSRFEERYAKQDLPLNDALQLLDYGVYFDINGMPQPTNLQGVAHFMLEEEIIIKQDNGLSAITNLGAILFAKQLIKFPRLARKAIRVVQFQGNNRLNILKEDVGSRGYVVGFEGLLKYIEALIPTRELIVGGLRKKESSYPLLAIREVVANALVHQDFSITGSGPIIEIFENHLEITNSGTPLVDIKRIIDNPPRSRNEKLASLMRRLRMCEELGSGWDKIVISCEFSQLPAPRIHLYEESTRVTLFSEVPFSSIVAEDRLWATYLHACIKQVEGEQLTNSSLRQRFGLKESASGTISRLIRDAVERKLIKPLDPNTAPRHMKYVPIWA